MTLNLRRTLVVSLWTGGLLLLVLIVSLVLWCVLDALGDPSGATVARVLALLVGICWMANLTTVVVLLAWGQSAAPQLNPPPVEPLNEEL